MKDVSVMTNADLIIELKNISEEIGVWMNEGTVPANILDYRLKLSKEILKRMYN